MSDMLIQGPRRVPVPEPRPARYTPFYERETASHCKRCGEPRHDGGCPAWTKGPPVTARAMRNLLRSMPARP